MVISQKLRDAINEQIKAELDSAYLYLAMSAYFESETLKGFAKWMRIQSKEEVDHALKFFDYVNDRGGRVELAVVDKPRKEWPSALAAFEDTLEHERVVTERIWALNELAKAEKDAASESFLKWYIDEQVEEESSASEIVDTLKRVGSSGNGLLMLDHQLGHRE